MNVEFLDVGDRECRNQKQILIIEDNKDAADSLKLLLELLGYDVVVAYDGQNGVEIANELKPDVVLSDIGLPELDGFSVARMLRRNPTTARAKLIAITAYGNDFDTRLMAEWSGFDHVITKPAEPASLVRLF